MNLLMIIAYVRSLHLYGGASDTNSTFFDDAWVYRLDDPAEYWRQDFTSLALYSTGIYYRIYYIRLCLL